MSSFGVTLELSFGAAFLAKQNYAQALILNLSR